MNRAAIIVYTDTESAEGIGRVMNALETAKEFKEHDEDVRLIFDGAGTKWIPELEDESHRLHPLYRTVKPETQVCDYCAEEFHIIDEVENHGLEIIDEYEGHPSVRSMVDDGYEVITL